MEAVDKIKKGEPVVDPDRMIRVQVAADAISSRSPPSHRDDKVTPPAIRTKTGTGFFVSDSGHIVTNAHVVEGCQTLRSSRGGQISKVSIDEQSDLALYIASEKPKAFARIRGGRGARAGEPIVAVGFPLSGLLSSDPIVTTGIISALSGLRNDRRTIQITAPVQPGNSGGPRLARTEAQLASYSASSMRYGSQRRLAISRKTSILP
jgi:S1-C subfamily serine protease